MSSVDPSNGPTPVASFKPEQMRYNFWDAALVVEFARAVGLFAVLRLQARLQAWLGHRVHLVPKDSLRPEVLEQVLSDGRRAA